MKRLLNKILNIKSILILGNKIFEDKNYTNTTELSIIEIDKSPSRTEIINYLLSKTSCQNYLEIGVRDPTKNFDKIICKNKFSVDPGIEFLENPVDYKMTSDDFFNLLKRDKLKNMSSEIMFDAIFIDGLHISSQVQKDISNSLKFIKDDGFIILHDCNPPTEYHQRENYKDVNSPAGILWNGTTWKAFYKYRHNKKLFSICFDTDWGVGVLTKRKLPLFNFLNNEIENEFYEYNEFNKNRNHLLNLQLFHKWVKEIK